MNVLILCAGYGSRLAPLTDRIPKPMVKIADKTGLEIQIEGCSELKYSNMCINTHHLAEELHTFATELPIQKVFFEPEILGTGGPLHRMYNEGYTDDLLVINCDIYHDFDLQKFVSEAQESYYSLLLIDNEQFNSVEVTENMVTGVRKVYSAKETSFLKTFSGVSWYSKEALADINKEHFSIVSFWKSAATKGKFGRALDNNGTVWIDIGTPQGLYEASFDRANKIGTPLVNGSLVGESVQLLDDVSIKDSIILDGTTLSGDEYDKAIVGEGIAWQL
ncbi:MAG: sugar phosphate nucleotidyltransferase [Fibrobacterales bacterium]